jgi:phytoene desaturase
MHAENKRIFSDPRLQQYFDRFATYNGSNPYEAPALLNLIPHLEHGYGTFFPKKGMHQITEALYALAQKCGITFHFNSGVKRILVSEGKAVGIRLMDDTDQWSDLVVCNADIRFAYKYLLPETPAPKAFERLESSSSAMIFYWGVKGIFPSLRLHNVFFSENYQEEFNAIFNGKGFSDDPTIYINIGSKCASADAPADGENWFIMVNVAADKGQDWDSIRAAIRAIILKKMSRILQTDLSKLIEAEDYLDPRRIETRTASIGGGLYGHASNERMAAFWRQANKSNRVKNLYFCGGSVHPGGGIPLCLNSAKITSELIAKYEN